MPQKVAIPDITEAVKGAKILIFVIPHQFISKLCDQIKPHITEGTIGISLIKVRSCHCSSCLISWGEKGEILSPDFALCFSAITASRGLADEQLPQWYISITSRQPCLSGGTKCRAWWSETVSVIQGIDEGPDGLKLISDIIREKLEIEVSVLMGANIASEVADEKFCETTIG